jgi:uncharacterized membrane protein
VLKDKSKSIITVLSVIGLLDSIYLSWLKLADTSTACFGGCDTVNASPFSELWGIPIAYMGVAAYFIILFITLIETKVDFLSRHASTLLFGITLVGILYSVYLTYLEIAVIHAICPYCVLSAITMFFLFIISLLRLRQEFDMV